jgi:hypothetical protein
LDLAIGANISLASLITFRAQERLIFAASGVAADYTRRLFIKTPAIFAPVATLSVKPTEGRAQPVARHETICTDSR